MPSKVPFFSLCPDTNSSALTHWLISYLKGPHFKSSWVVC